MTILSSIASYVAPLSHSAREHRRENFPAMTHAEANDAQVATLLEQAPREDLIVEIQRLRAENAQLRMAAELPHLPAVERCINWPCAKPAGHAGPCSTELGTQQWEAGDRASDPRLEVLDMMELTMSEAIDCIVELNNLIKRLRDMQKRSRTA